MAKQSTNRRSGWGFVIGGILIAAVLAVFLVQREQKDAFSPDSQQPLISQLEAIEGGARTVNQAELAFFEDILEDLLPTDLGEQERREATQNYVNEVNAAFFLGSRLQLCNPFSLEAFEKELSGENERREEMGESGEVFFGPDHFDLRSYFNYRYSTLMSEISNWLIEHRDADLIARTRDFYEQQKEAFNELVQVEFELTGAQGTEHRTVTQEDFRLLSRQDGELLDALAESSLNEPWQLSDGRILVKINEKYEMLPFEENEGYIVQAYLMNGGLHGLLQTIAVGNPVTLP